MLNGAIALIAAYLLGSIPTAYLITRWLTKKDIRQLGSGNVGAHNVFHQVGKTAGIAVGVLDVAKGAVAVLFAMALPDAPLAFVFASGLAVVIGHMWPVFLKFAGGNGLATSLGVFSVLMTFELLIAFALTMVLVILTHNVILSINASLVSLPVSAWLVESPRLGILYATFTIILLLVIALHFLPVAKAEYAHAGSWGKLFAQLLRQESR